MKANRPDIVRPMTVPCGRCIGCRLEKSRQWAVRCFHEGQMHEEKIFLTLTYDDENLPYMANLIRRDFQLFMKRIRKKLPNVRVYYCGEYGENTNRPHYHAILFGWEPEDKIPIRGLEPEDLAFTSEQLSKFWGLGLTEFSQVTFESCAYVSRYITKKVTGEPAEEHYQRNDLFTGEIFQLQPEFSGMSLRPGIGIPWLEKWADDVYPRCSIIIRGQEMAPPKAYDRWIKEHRPDLWEKSKEQRASIEKAAHLKSLLPGKTHRCLAGIKINEQKLQQRKKV